MIILHFRSRISYIYKVINQPPKRRYKLIRMAYSLTPSPTDPVSVALDALIVEFDHQPGVSVSLRHTKNGPTSYVTLEKLVVHKESRNRNVGTTIMHRLCAFADTHGAILPCSPTSEFGGSKTRLVKFYKGFGFVNNRKRSGVDYFVKETMIRHPNP